MFFFDLSKLHVHVAHTCGMWLGNTADEVEVKEEVAPPSKSLHYSRQVNSTHSYD